jgi:hypothetical protein
MIQGYASPTSVFPGDSISFYVSTDAPQFRIDFYRQGSTLQFINSTAWFAGVFADNHEPDGDWSKSEIRRDGKQVAAWTPSGFSVPNEWLGGVYIAMLVEGDGNGNANPNQNPPLNTGSPDGQSAKALFVVKNPSPGVQSQVLYKIPLFTYQMYNMTTYTGVDGKLHAGAGYPFNDPSNPGTDTPQYWVALGRPGGGTGGTPWDSMYFPNAANADLGNWDHLDSASFRQTFIHWDAKMIVWLESNGYRVDYCTDLDIHNDTSGELLSHYSLVLSVGHDEYYSTEMRDNLEGFVAKGGNIAFFSGNTCYWRLYFPVKTAAGEDDQRFITRDYEWWTPTTAMYPAAPNRPEDSLTGVGFRNAGERNDPLPADASTYLGYTVQNTGLWPFAGSGLKDNDTFGEDLCLIGYEADGTPYSKASGRPVSPAFNPADTTPPGLVILGTADTSVWSGLAGGVPAGNMAATMAIYQKNGTVFTGATTDWPRVLSLADSAAVTITRNVINRLGGTAKGLTTLTNLGSVVACDGFFTPDDKSRHAMTGIADGSVWEIYYNPQRGVSQTKVATIPGLIDLGSFYTPDDNYRHALVATDSGTLWEVFFNPQTGIGQDNLGTYQGMFRVAGFFSDDDGDRHAIVATQSGEILEVYFNPKTGKGQAPLGQFNGIVDIGAFYSADDKNRHAIVATNDGTIYEIYYNPSSGKGQTILGTFPGVTRVSAFYIANDTFFSRRVIVWTSGGTIYQIKYSAAAGIIRTVLFAFQGVIDIGGFYSPDDGDRHVLVASNNGSIDELFFEVVD